VPILRAPAESSQDRGSSDGPELPPLRTIDSVDFSPAYRGEEVAYAQVKVWTYANGGCELVARAHFAKHNDGDGERGVPCTENGTPLVAPRKPFEERSPQDRERAAMRAKAAVRRHVRQLGANYMATFSTREWQNTREDLYEKFEEFVRRYERALGRNFNYVAVAERHPTNPKHWHLHVAVNGWHKINVTRPLWWAVMGGRGMGTIQMEAGRAYHLPPEERSMRIARYLSKYITKSFADESMADKKRYSRSRFDAAAISVLTLVAKPDRERGLLTAAVMDELRETLGVDLGTVIEASRSGNGFVFPDGGGFWLQLASGWSQPPPPF
jgi:hypothetical protein